MRRTVFLVALAVTLTACASTVEGRPAAAGPPFSPSDANAVFGDFTTVDPCRLIDLSGLPDYRPTVLPTDSLDDCALAVTVDNAPAVARVGELDSTFPGFNNPTQQLPDGIISFQEPLANGTCAEYLGFTGAEVNLRIAVSASSGPGNAAFCSATQDIARDLTAVIDKGPVAHRAPFPAGSFGRLTACTLANTSTLLRKEDFDVEDPQVYPAGHQCLWEDGEYNENRYVTLHFTVGPPPSAGPGTTAGTLAGRPTLTTATQGGDAADCLVQTAGMAFGAPSAHLVELAQVHVHEQGDQGDDPTAACASAAALAGLVWPKLPKTP